MPELCREEISVGRCSIIDLWEQPLLADAAYDLAQQIGGRIRIAGVTLEQAALAMNGEER